MGCTESTAIAAPSVKFENGKPTFQGDDIVKGFEQGNGLLFRIVNTGKKQWAYYNDTKEYEMHVKVTFNEGFHVVALGRTRIKELDHEVVATIIVAPLATEMFIQGDVQGFKAQMDAVPVSRWTHSVAS